MEYKGLTLDKFQEDSMNAIESNHSVVVSAPTGSGKTLIADYLINKYLPKNIRIIYTAPIKALSNQKYKEFVADFGKEKIGLLTGDVVINSTAPVLIMTTEIYRNMAMINDKIIDSVSYVVFDEIHYINDIERGYVWEESIIFSKPHIRFLCLSATIPNAEEFASWIKSIKYHEVITIKHSQRPVPLHKKFYDAQLGITTLDKIRDVKDIPNYDSIMSRRYRPKPPNHVELVRAIRDKLPCFFFNFSRQGCQDSALELAKAKIFKINPEINTFVRKHLAGAQPEIGNLKSTKLLRQTLPYGIAFHHAGLIPIIKLLVEELFSQGKINVLYTTETFAVGINMPAKTVCFKSLRKFDGINFRFLNSKEYFQIAGRAGRRGIDTEGFVYAMIDNRDFDYDLLKKITGADLMPIKSQFRLSVNTVLNIVRQHTQAEIDKILAMNFHTYQTGSAVIITNSFNKIKKKLIERGYIENDKLTKTGDFLSKIYSDELLTGEIFSSEFFRGLNTYQILLLVACLCYEPKVKDEFYVRYKSKQLHTLKAKLRHDKSIGKDKKFRYIDSLTALVYPCFQGKNIFQIMENSSFLEGDILRLFRQMLDRLAQIRNATTDAELRQLSKNCRNVINNSLADIDSI